MKSRAVQYFRDKRFVKRLGRVSYKTPDLDIRIPSGDPPPANLAMMLPEVMLPADAFRAGINPDSYAAPRCQFLPGIPPIVTFSFESPEGEAMWSEMARRRNVVFYTGKPDPNV